MADSKWSERREAHIESKLTAMKTFEMERLFQESSEEEFDAVLKKIKKKSFWLPRSSLWSLEDQLWWHTSPTM